MLFTWVLKEKNWNNVQAEFKTRVWLERFDLISLIHHNGKKCQLYDEHFSKCKRKFCTEESVHVDDISVHCWFFYWFGSAFKKRIWKKIPWKVELASEQNVKLSSTGETNKNSINRLKMKNFTTILKSLSICKNRSRQRIFVVQKLPSWKPRVDQTFVVRS